MKKKNISKLCIGITMGLLIALSPVSFFTGGSDAAGRYIPGCVSAKSIKNEKKDVSEDSNSILNIASVSKMYVVTAVMQLVDEGKVDLDAPVTDYITDFEMEDERYKDITVRMLMNHTSGLMGSVYEGGILFDEKREDYHDTFLTKVKKEHLKADPGEFNCYCNDGFTLLEILVERVTDMSFTDYLKENISKPLSMNNTGTMWDSDFDKQIPVYINDNIKLANQVPQLIGAGGIMSDAKDVCTFGSAFFTGDNILLSEKAKNEMAENNEAGDSKAAFGLGWDTVVKEDYEKAGVKVLSKGGDTSQHANLLVAPDEKISVAVLSSGGSSSNCEQICLDLLDEALLSEGIKVEHSEKKVADQIDVPEELLKYEGLYANADKTLSVSFPDKKYMKIVSVTSDNDFEYQYIYTKDDVFVSVTGDVESGNAIPEKPVQEIIFEEKDGQVYLSDPDYGPQAYKVPENKVDSKVQKAWDERNESYYYLVSGKYSDASYIDNNRMMIKTSKNAPGYVNGYAMKDANYAYYDVIIPGTVSRDISDLKMEEKDGKEYMCLDSLGFRLISEKDIETFSDGISKVELKSGEAKWYKLDGVKGETLKLTIPEKASVYVFDKYMNIKYSSYMKGYGDSVPLPEYGMIVFVGEDGKTVEIDR